MQDQSHLDKQYFIDIFKYNCPYCNRNHVSYTVTNWFGFDWATDKRCYGYRVRCASCGNVSLHLSWLEISTWAPPTGRTFDITLPHKDDEKEYKLFDELFFYHQPTSFFTIDNRIPCVIRELIAEAEGCRKMNYLTGASACLRKSIYELLRKEGIGADAGDYKKRISALKGKFPEIDPMYFDVLSNVKDMTDDRLHEESWGAFDSSTLQKLLEVTKSILYEMYVLPEEKRDRLGDIPKLLDTLKKDKKGKQVTDNSGVEDVGS
ncbi:MAG: hypothetical protein ACUZ77_01450 [Candidatus Brocadiales bacterium]